MSSKNQDQVADIQGPRTGQIAVIATSGTSAATDMTGLDKRWGSVLVDLIADVDVYYRWGASGETADETATTGNNRVFLMPANTRITEKPTGTHLIHKATASGHVRVAISSQ